MRFDEEGLVLNLVISASTSVRLDSQLRRSSSPVTVAREHRSQRTANQVNTFIRRKAAQHRPILGSVERPPSPVESTTTSASSSVAVDPVSAAEEALFAPVYLSIRTAMIEINERMRELAAEAHTFARRRFVEPLLYPALKTIYVFYGTMNQCSSQLGRLVQIHFRICVLTFAQTHPIRIVPSRRTQALFSQFSSSFTVDFFFIQRL